MNAAILLSGGTGSRISSEVPKQYLRIGESMLITYALEPLLKSSFIDMVEIVADIRWREDILEDARKAGGDVKKISGFVAPGVNRQTSILNGLEAILRKLKVQAMAEEGTLVEAGGGQPEIKPEADGVRVDTTDSDTVFIHDAARPFLTENLIERCYIALTGHDGVLPVLPMKDTVYLSGGGTRVEELLDRGHVYAGQAPELFLLKKYYEANRALLPSRIMKINGSTEPAVMAGMEIAMIPGDEGNFKVTTRADIQRLLEYVRRKGGKEDESMGAARTQRFTI